MFRPGEGTGGGRDDDPFDQDEILADHFKKSVRRQQDAPLSTPRAYGIPDLSQRIQDRVDGVCQCLILIGPALRPVAERLYTIRYPSDRANPDIVARHFEGFNLDG